MGSGLPTKAHFQADELTWREQEVLLLLADRCSNREIAERLHLAETTVKDYVSKILSKLYVKNRRQAVARARELGLLDQFQDSKTPIRILLPAEPTPFVGRIHELAEIQELLTETRLLTLVGPGGIGKTRLAIKTARQISADYQDGVFFVPLAPITSPDWIVHAIAEAVKFPLMTRENPKTQLVRFLKNKQLLLVVDNFEHLLDGVQIVSEILSSAVGVKILATSREKLNLTSETLFIVGGMYYALSEGPAEDEKNEASTLFIQSAHKVCPGFIPDRDQLRQIEMICELVQGTPLAIELAAAWLQILSLDEISAELDQGFDILSTQVRDTPERHRSLRAVFEHSWRLLDSSARRSLMTLSVFRGGFTRRAAQEVSHAALQELMELVNKSFLHHNPETGRLEFHELLRQFAQEELHKSPGERNSAEAAHANFYANFMEARWQELKGKRQLPALMEIEADLENIRAAWKYYQDPYNSPQIWKFVYSLWFVFWVRGWYLVGSGLFADAAQPLTGEQNPENAALRALMIAMQSYFMAWLDISAHGYELASEAESILEQFDYPEALMIALVSLIVNSYFHDRWEEFKYTKLMMDIASKSHDKWLKAFALYVNSMSELIWENYAAARQMAMDHLNLCEEIGDQVYATVSLIVIGHSALAQGDYAEAEGSYLRSLEISEEIGFHFSLQTATKYLGKVAISLGKLQEAEHYLLQCLQMTKEIGFVRDVVNLYYEFARLDAARDEPERAVALLTYVIQHPASVQKRMMEGRIRDSANALLEQLKDELPEDRFQNAVMRGSNMELEQLYAQLVQ